MEEPQEHIDIAVTTMAYSNAQLISLLQQRGAAILAENWDSMRTIDGTINTQKDQNLEEWTRPCSVFITFQNEEGLQRAINMSEVIKKDYDTHGYLNEWFGDEAIEIQPASEPSDIIWEHRHFTDKQRFKKSIVVGLVIFLMLAVSFVVIFIAQKVALDITNTFPVVNCVEFDVYGDTLPTLALDEYKVNKAKKEKGLSVSYNGYVQCYCQDTVTEGITPQTYDGHDICTDYFASAKVVLAVTNAVSTFIVIVNTFIKT